MSHKERLESVSDLFFLTIQTNYLNIIQFDVQFLSIFVVWFQFNSDNIDTLDFLKSKWIGCWVNLWVVQVDKHVSALAEGHLLDQVVVCEVSNLKVISIFKL